MSTVQQSDPLGPLLSALVLRKVIKQLRLKHRDLALGAWYLDDGALVGPRSTLLDVLKELSGTDVKALGSHQRRQV